MRIQLLLLFLIGSFGGKAQSVKGITHVRDTTYSTYSAYQSTVKTHPDIKIVGEQPSDKITEKRDMTYCSGGSNPLRIDAFYPKDSSKTYPAVVIIHGGGWRTGNRGQHIPLAQRLAASGYACFTIEYRLSTEALYPAAVFDVKSAIRWIRSRAKTFFVDPSKVCALGFSAGGQLAALVGNTNGDRRFEGLLCNITQTSDVQAIIDIDGILAYIHPESGEGDDSKSTSAATYWFGYSKTQRPDIWNEASALHHVSSKTPPTLFLNSAVERMHAGRTDYIKKMDALNIYTEVHTFENAPHSFLLFDPWFEPTLKYIDQFLKKTLKP